MCNPVLQRGTFSLDDEAYGIDVMQVQEVLRAIEIFSPWNQCGIRSSMVSVE